MHYQLVGEGARVHWRREAAEEVVRQQKPEGREEEELR